MDKADREHPLVEKGSRIPAAGKHRKPALWREAAGTLLAALAIFALSRSVVQGFRIEGPSMEPTLHEGQFLLVSKLAHEWGQLQRGDIVVFRYPHNPRRDFVKRVVGLPGELVEILRGQVWINGLSLDEPYVLETGSYSYPARVVEPDSVFVLGDNRNNSSDSHMWGSLPTRYIIGKPILCYWPPRYWGLLRDQRPTVQ